MGEFLLLYVLAFYMLIMHLLQIVVSGCMMCAMEWDSWHSFELVMLLIICVNKQF